METVVTRGLDRTFLSYTNLYSNKYNVVTSLFKYSQPNEINDNFDIVTPEESDALQSELPTEVVPGNMLAEENDSNDHEYVWLLCSVFDLANEGIAVDESTIPVDQIPEQCRGNK